MLPVPICPVLAYLSRLLPVHLSVRLSKGHDSDINVVSA